MDLTALLFASATLNFFSLIDLLTDFGFLWLFINSQYLHVSYTFMKFIKARMVSDERMEIRLHNNTSYILCIACGTLAVHSQQSGFPCFRQQLT